MQSQPLEKENDAVVSKEQQKVSATSFSIVDHMKKATVSIPMFDVLLIPRKKDMLQDALVKISISDVSKKD